jgi:hypothetical protein
MESVSSQGLGLIECVNLRELSGEITIENPFQRVPNPDKIKMIKDALIEEKRRLKLDDIPQTGVIQIGKFDGKTYILDGQHRFEAYKQLNSPTFIWIQRWSFLSLDEMRRKFIEINSNTPVESYIMDVTLPQTQKSAYDVLIDYVQTTYKGYIVTTDKPYFPNININKFRSIIHLIEELKGCDSKSIVFKFEEWNKKCLEILRNHKVKREKEYYDKCTEKGFKLFINRAVNDLPHKQI